MRLANNRVSPPTLVDSTRATKGTAIAFCRTSGMRALLAVLVLYAGASWSQEGTRVQVEKRGGTVVIDVEMPVQVPAATAWAVLTDYDNMVAYISNLRSSKVLSKRGNSMTVAQSGTTRVAFMEFSFSAVRSVSLHPHREIESSLVTGDFESYSSTTKIVGADNAVRIVHHGEYVPKSWLPPIVGVSVIEAETRKQYGEFAAEMRRRHATK
jgi:ribosome-associated toxin RatA of RatAB toxin-antitoxin module